VKRWLVVLVLFAACRHAATPVGQPLPGAVAPRVAVEQFLSAVRAQDLQAMAVIWGNAKGPARDQFDRTELEKREIIMQSCLDHEKFRILNEAPGEGGQRVFRVELTKGTVTATPLLTTVKGPSERWYVTNAELAAAQPLCRQG
jgi:hypothetical protein